MKKKCYPLNFRVVLCFNTTASTNSSDHITSGRQTKRKVVKHTHYIGTIPKNIASKCVNFSVFELALPLGDRNVSSTHKLLMETAFDTGGGAEKGWVGQSDPPAASWQPEESH